ncbi:MAG TPA: hypothetical protein VGR88_03700 [Ktedonobacterales bacterium]|nr:hypothetical protein [Ktedonobacterales bacterium]
MGRGGLGGAFFLGLGLLVVGAGATVFSYTHTAPGGTYFIFGGLILGGLVRMITALLGGMGSNAFPTRRDTNRSEAERAAWYEDPNAEYVEKLADVPSGYCWQCGSKLRRGRTICMACGAAQTTAAPERTSTATPGGMTFGPPPKLARSGHPYDAPADQPEGAEPDDMTPPRRSRAFFPADPDGSYGSGPAYPQSQDRGVRSAPGATPGGRGPRAEDERPRRPVAGRETPRGGRANAGPARPAGGAPLDRWNREPRQDEPPSGRRAPRPEMDDAYRQPPPRRPRDDDGWDVESESDDEGDSRAWQQSARRQPMRPRRPTEDEGDDWDDGYTPPRSPRGR